MYKLIFDFYDEDDLFETKRARGYSQLDDMIMTISPVFHLVFMK